MKNTDKNQIAVEDDQYFYCKKCQTTKLTTSGYFNLDSESDQLFDVYCWDGEHWSDRHLATGDLLDICYALQNSWAGVTCEYKLHMFRGHEGCTLTLKIGEGNEDEDGWAEGDVMLQIRKHICGRGESI